MALAYAKDMHIGEARHGAIALVTIEMATNLVKHAGRGHILVQPLQDGEPGMRLISVDKGPGIFDVALALSDGHSTAGSMGGGLGAIRRLADSFHLYSVAGGTVICAEFRRDQKSRGVPRVIDVGAVSEPIAGEDVCGDGWGMRQSPDGVIFMVVDGLGHGILAAEAAREAERVFLSTPANAPLEIVELVHAALRNTRGAALAVARLEVKKGLLTFAGVGNISGSILEPAASRGMASHNGIAGHNLPRVQEFSYPWNRNSILVMHSDGLATRWDLERYAGIRTKAPTVIAAVLHRDFSRSRDDATVVVAKAAA